MFNEEAGVSTVMLAVLDRGCMPWWQWSSLVWPSGFCIEIILKALSVLMMLSSDCMMMMSLEESAFDSCPGDGGPEAVVLCSGELESSACLFGVSMVEWLRRYVKEDGAIEIRR